MKRFSQFPYLPKDFIETAEGLIFAVVTYGPQAKMVGCFLRYVLTDAGWQKITTDDANVFLTEHYPNYLYHSEQFDASFHAVKIGQIIRHYKPEVTLSDLIRATSGDKTVQCLQRLVPILVRYGADIKSLGITGSLLIGCQKSTSDIDLIAYGRDSFHSLRSSVQCALTNGELSALNDHLMRDNFQRRLGELAYEDFAWHENRKFNKAVIDGVKFDIGMVEQNFYGEEKKQYKKQGVSRLVARVVDDQFSFDFPARYTIDDQNISEVVVYTQTYVGQAKIGEKIEVSGAVEYDVASKECRLIVGSSREAVGEYIKVIKNNE